MTFSLIDLLSFGMKESNLESRFFPEKTVFMLPCIDQCPGFMLFEHRYLKLDGEVVVTLSI